MPFRRLSSSRTGLKDSSASHLFPQLLNSPTPSALRGVISIFDLAQAGVDMGKRQHGKQTEASFVIGNHPRAIFVFAASNVASLIDVSKPDTRSGDGNHRSRNTASIHIFDGSRRCVWLPCLVALSLLRIHHG